MTLAQRMYIQIAIAFLGLIGIAGLALIQTERVFEAANFSTVNVVPSLIDLDQATRAFGLARAEVWQYPVAPDDASRHQIMDRFNADLVNIQKQLDDYEKNNIADDKDRGMLKDDRDALDAYVKMAQPLMTMVNEGKAAEATTALFNNHAAANNVAAALSAHNDYNVALGKKAEADATEIRKQARLQEIVISLIVLAIVFFIGVKTSRRIVMQLAEAVSVAETVASGDLTSRIDAKSNDEIGALLKALGHMNENLVRIVGQVRTGTNTMMVASTEIAQGNMDLSSRTESQASSLEETAASMEELTSTVKQNSENAQQANQLALSASEVALKGGTVVSQVVDTMGAINDSARKIVDIISVIDGIAFQTNILALNAAVEAARAGEQGRGFAVVATEVRNLAQRSAAAAKEIKELINNSVEKVDIGTRLVDEAGTTMREVVDSVRRVTDIMAEINAASAEQSQGIGQVNQAVMEMDTVTQQNAALVEEAAAAAKSMQEQAGKLTEVVSVFKINQNDFAPAAASHQPREVVAISAAKPKASIPAARPKTASLAIAKPAAAGQGGDDWEEF